jgi:integrase
MPTRRKGKRANGEGSVHRRQDGRWAAVVSFKNVDGETRRRTVYAKTQAEALGKKAELIQARSLGTLVGSSTETVGEFLEMWLRDVVPINRRPTTVQTYRSIVTNHLIPRIGTLRLDKLRPAHVDQIQRAALDEGMSPRTVQTIRATLGVALKAAITRGYLGRNPATGVEAPQIEPYEATILHEAEARHFLTAVRGSRFEAGYVVTLYLGLRMGEVLGLRWEDIDWKKKRIHIRRQLDRRGPPPVFADVKTKKSRRTLPLILDLETVLRQHRTRQLEERLTAGRPLPEYGLIFTRPDGEAYAEKAILDAFRGILQAAGLPSMRFHDLRHSCATLLASAGVSQRLSMAILGHASLKVNQEVYTHVIEDDVAEAVESLAQSITRSETGDEERVAVEVAVKTRDTA